MYKTVHAFYLAAVLLAAAANPTPVVAQHSHADSVAQRNDCRLAEQVLVHGRPANKRAWALGYFVRCEAAARIGSAVLAQIEGASPADQEEIVEALANLVDRRLAFAALDRAKSAGRSPAERVNALRVLYAQVEPGYAVGYEYLTRHPTVRESAAGGVVVNETDPPPFLISDVPIFGSGLRVEDVAEIARQLTALQRAELPEIVLTAAERVAVAYRSRYRYLTLCPPGTAATACLNRMKQKDASTHPR
jgi:hypothetical protein